MSIRLPDPEENAILNSVYHTTTQPGEDPGPEYHLANIAGILKQEIMDEIYEKFCIEQVKTYDITQEDGSCWHLYLKE